MVLKIGFCLKYFEDGTIYQIRSSTPIFNQVIFHATLGNESKHTLHTREIDKEFQNGILRYIGLTIGLILYPTR